MKCPNNCRCGKHFRHDPRQNNRVRYPQMTQAERMRIVTAERHKRGTVWRGTPSGTFDWDYAIKRNRETRREIYGDDNEIQ